MDIAFLTPNVHYGTAPLVWRTMARTASRYGHRLFIFPGGRIAAQPGHEALKNRIYELLKTGFFSKGISWVSALGGISGEEAVKAFHRDIPGIEWVSIGTSLDTGPSITIDAYSGMEQLLAHFYEVHGVKRFAFIRGPEVHGSADDRFRAFTDFVARRGLSLQAQTIFGPCGWMQGRSAVLDGSNHLDRLPGRDYQALIGTSDLLAYHGVLALQELGYQPLRDYLVGGFNDSPESRLLNPSFTTVHLPFDTIGEQALLRATGRTADSLVIQPRLVIRRSCGCFSHASEAISQQPVPVVSYTDLAFPKLLALELLSQIQGGREEDEAWIQPLVSSLVKTLGTNRIEGFIKTLAEVLERVIGQGLPIHVWQDALSAAHKRCASGMEAIRHPWLVDLFDRARLVVSDAMEKSSILSTWRDNELFAKLQDFEHRLLGLPGIEKLSGLFQECLPALGIESAFLVTIIGESRDLVNETRHLSSEPCQLEGASRRVSAGFDKEGSLTEQIDFKESGLLPQSMMNHLKPGNSWFVLPLCDDSTYFGYLLVELGIERADVYEQLRMAVTGALRALALVEQLRMARDAARKAEAIKTRFLANAGSELLAPVSRIHQLVLSDNEISPSSSLLTELKRLMLMSRDLSDFSRAQVGELDIHLKVLEPSEILTGFKASLGRSMSTSDSGNLGYGLPCINGDLSILLRMMEGIVQAFTAQADVNFADVGLKTDRSGLALVMEFTGGLKTPELWEEESISWILYRRIMVLHGGSIEQVHEGGRVSVTLRFPFPGISGQTDDSMLEGRVLVIGSSPQDADFSKTYSHLGLELVRLDQNQLFATDPNIFSAILFQADQAQQADWRIVSRLRKHARYGHLPALVHPSQELLQLARDKGLDLAAAIAQHCADLGTGSIVVIRLNDWPVNEVFNEPGLDIVVIRSLSNLSAFAQDEQPGLFVCFGGNFELIRAIRGDARWSAVPILNMVDDCSGLGMLDADSDLARVSLLHAGVYNSQELAARLEALRDTSGYLPPQTGMIVKRALVYLDAHFQEPLSRWQLAESVSASEDYLTRVFHRELGISPWEYLTRLRVVRSGVLLRTTGLTVQELACRVGFPDQAYFCRVFRRYMDTSPLQYRNARKNL